MDICPMARMFRSQDVCPRDVSPTKKIAEKQWKQMDGKHNGEDDNIFASGLGLCQQKPVSTTE